MQIGYARVSTQDQDLRLQYEALRHAQCDKIYDDKASGTKASREGLKLALGVLRENDTLVVWKLDRLGRSVKDLVTIVCDLEQRGVHFKSLTDQIDTSTPSGRFFFHIMASLAQMERDLTIERTRAGLEAARRQGRTGGRKRKMTDSKINAARRLIQDGTPARDVAKNLGVSIPTLYRWLPVSQGLTLKPENSLVNPYLIRALVRAENNFSLMPKSDATKPGNPFAPPTPILEPQFELPKLNTLGELISQSESQLNPVAKLSELQTVIESLKTPWLDSNNKMRSINGLAEYQRIGKILASQPPFSESVNNILRSSLGDWRKAMNWPESIYTDLSARLNFYKGLGFNPYLADYPDPAFQEIVRTTGIRRNRPRLLETYGLPVPRPDNLEEEEAFARTNDAHDWLFRLETHMRNFIDNKMSKAFGTEWPNRRLPNNTHKEWKEKKEQARDTGRDVKSLIAYADFTDYERIICKRDNWREVFQPYFIRTENVRETFQRLHLIRLDTMHARPITQDDELLLFTETRRLIRLTTVKSG